MKSYEKRLCLELALNFFLPPLVSDRISSSELATFGGFTGSCSVFTGLSLWRKIGTFLALSSTGGPVVPPVAVTVSVFSFPASIARMRASSISFFRLISASSSNRFFSSSSFCFMARSCSARCFLNCSSSSRNLLSCSSSFRFSCSSFLLRSSSSMRRLCSTSSSCLLLSLASLLFFSSSSFPSTWRTPPCLVCSETTGSS